MNIELVQQHRLEVMRMAIEIYRLSRHPGLTSSIEASTDQRSVIEIYRELAEELELL